MKFALTILPLSRTNLQARQDPALEQFLLQFALWPELDLELSQHLVKWLFLQHEPILIPHQHQLQPCEQQTQMKRERYLAHCDQGGKCAYGDV